MRIRSCRRLGAAFLLSCAAAVVLSGCESVSLAAPPSSSAAPVAEAAPVRAAPAPTTPTETAVSAPAVAPAPAVAVPQQPTRIEQDGTIARFAGTQTALPAQTLALLEAVAADRANHRRRWEIKGYSDRNAQPNARELALTRALAVRKVLVDRGLPPAQIKVLYSTEQAREVVTLLPL